jgi:hypothetical protein
MGLPFLLKEICGPILGIYIHMNVEIGAEAALFPEKEYINGIAVAVWRESRRGSVDKGNRPTGYARQPDTS